MASERNRKLKEFEEVLKLQVEEKKRKQEEIKRQEEEKDKLADLRLQKQIEDEMNVDHDPKKHRKKNLNTQTKSVTKESPVLVIDKQEKETNKDTSNDRIQINKLSSKNNLELIKEVPDVESESGNNNSIPN